MGLPLAREASYAGVNTFGFDVSPGAVDSLNSGVSYIDDIEDADVAKMLTNGFRATCDPSIIGDVDVVVICVPTPLSEEGGPDLQYVRVAGQTVAEHMRSGTLVILESTTYPGTTEDVLLPILESRGLIGGVDFNLAYSPERIDPGNNVYGAKNTPKVVGGYTSECADAAIAFYDTFVDTTVRTSGTREAEMAKLLENTYRHVNIALVNEMARFCHDLGIDLWDAIDAAKTKPFGFQAFYPGPGVGGHCIPIDPNYLSHNVKTQLGYPFRFVELAQEINSRMPLYAVERIQDILNNVGMPLKGSVILVLGVTYKSDISDQRESPAVEVASRLLAKGAVVRYHDPFVDQWSSVPEAQRVESPLAFVEHADLTVLLQNHSEYDVPAIANASKLFFDTRGSVVPDQVSSFRL
ncbi:nucleotide sugar dehydrogenase [Dietzia cinnamea]|nr:nucleotide sugar dehydrogenase [Dietzia cinnamea]